MLQPWRTAKVIKIEDATSTTKRFWFEIPELSDFEFKPGQFVTLDLPIHEQKNKRWRSYSIASRPDGTNVFELVIVKLEGGAGTTYLFNEVSVGTEILYRGPQGVFVLPETIDKELFLICTGTGIAPFRSMIQHIHHHQIQHPTIHLIFGCRYFGDALYKEELEALTRDEKNFFYHTVYSREHPSNKYNTGYVHQVYESIIAANKITDANFYLCGWKNMIDDAREKLTALGFDKKSIHFEIYG